MPHHVGRARSQCKPYAELTLSLSNGIIDSPVKSCRSTSSLITGTRIAVLYRTETFCYGPLSCSVYKPGLTRKAPGRKGMAYEEEDWVDRDVTSHRRAEA